VIRILLADDQALVRGALAALLDLETDIQVVAQVGRGDEVVAAARSSRADVCLLDIEMPGLTGLEVAERLRAELPAVRSLIVTTFGQAGLRAPRPRRRAPPASSSRTRPLASCDAVRRVHAGLRVVDPDLATESLMSGPSPLTTRESEILLLAIDGAPVAVIAERAQLSIGTVRNHLSAAIGKTGASTRAEAARLAQSNGWI
jgi:two-component system response regulator DesR